MLTRRTKLVYPLGELGAGLPYVAVNTWLLYYLVNVAGLAPFAAGAAFVLGRAVDAVADPVVGVISDRLRPTRGRLVFVRRGAPLAAATFLLLWVLPLVGGPLRLPLAIVGFAAFSAAYTVTTMPYLALTPELARGYDERTTLTSFRLAVTIAASLLAVAVPPAIALGLTGASDLAGTPASGWLVAWTGFAVLIAAGLLAVGFGLREPAGRTVTVLPERPAAELRSALRTRGYPTLLGVFLLVTLALMITNSLLPFYLESALGLPGEAQPLVLLALFGTSVLAFPGWTAASARWGKRACLAAGLAVAATGLVLLVTVVPRGGTGAALWAVAALSGIGVAALSLFPWAMLPDLADVDEARTGRRREGLLYALFTFVQKAAGSLGVFATAFVTGVLGYEEGSAVQSAEVVRGLDALMGPVAAVVCLAALALVLRYPVTRESHASVIAALDDPARDPVPG